MQEYLEEIQASPGVMGSCVYSTEQGIIASNLPAAFKSDIQQRIAGVLHRIFRLNDQVKLDVSTFEIQYEEALILVKKLCNNASLLVICEPAANSHLVTMTISMLSNDLQAAISDCERPPEPEPEPQPTQETDPETVLQGELSGELTRIRKALAESIGPVAGMTLKKYLASWLEQGPAEKQRLAELTEALLTEIDDKASRKEFSKRLKDL